MSSMITTTSWVRRGVAAQMPIKYEIDEEEMNRISTLAKLQLEDAQSDLKAAQEGDDDDDDEAMEEDDKKDVMEEDSGKKTEATTAEYVWMFSGHVWIDRMVQTDLAVVTMT